MRRYRPNKPSRREVRAAIEFYAPHNWWDVTDEGAMPENVPPDYTSELYKRGVCWWTFKGRKFDTSQHICGLTATLREVVRITQLSLGETSKLSVSMWLCDKHAGRLKSQGFVVTVVTEPPSQPYAIIKP